VSKFSTNQSIKLKKKKKNAQQQVIDIVSISLNSLKNSEEQAGVTKDKADPDEVDESSFETSFLEEAVKKMAELLNMGYGAAGAEIIQRNLGLSEGERSIGFEGVKRVRSIAASFMHMHCRRSPSNSTITIG
jgi:hypothetical protein